MPFHPAITAINQKGTITEKNGNCLPTMALKSFSGNPVTAASAIIGVPSAPKATGAVLPIKASPAAGSGLNPNPISNAAQIATGVPNPAAPSINAPKLKAISNTCKRRSSVSPAIDCLMISNFPVCTVMSKTNMAHSTIQPMGNNP